MRATMTFADRRRWLAVQRYRIARQQLFVLCGRYAVRPERREWV